MVFIARGRARGHARGRGRGVGGVSFQSKPAHAHTTPGSHHHGSSVDDRDKTPQVTHYLLLVTISRT